MRKLGAARMAQRTETRWGQKAQQAVEGGCWPSFHVNVDTTLPLLLDRSEQAQIVALPLIASVTLASRFSSLSFLTYKIGTMTPTS